MSAPDRAVLLAWLDGRQAEVEHDHRANAGIVPTSCYCDVPEPCEDRIQQLAAIEELRAILTRSVELVAENMRIHRELDAVLDGNQRLQTMNEGLRQIAIDAREAANGWHQATIDLYSGREEPHPANCPCGRQETCMPQRPETPQCGSHAHPDFVEDQTIRCELPDGHAWHRNGERTWTP